MRIKNIERLTNHGNVKGRRIIATLLDAGLDSLDPYYRVKKFVKIIVYFSYGCHKFSLAFFELFENFLVIF